MNERDRLAAEEQERHAIRTIRHEVFLDRLNKFCLVFVMVVGTFLAVGLVLLRK